MNCPNCKQGRLFPAIPHENFPETGLECDICNGTGILPESYDYLPNKGKALKDERIKEQVHLREASLKQGISAWMLSRKERGYFEKDEKCAINE